MSTSSPSVVDHTSKPTAIVGSAEARANVKKTFVVATYGRSNTSDPCPTLVSQAMKANARPDSPTTKGYLNRDRTMSPVKEVTSSRPGAVGKIQAVAS